MIGCCAVSCKTEVAQSLFPTPGSSGWPRTRCTASGDTLKVDHTYLYALAAGGFQMGYRNFSGAHLPLCKMGLRMLVAPS